MNVRQRVGRAVKIRRTVINMKQADLAEAAGISRAFVSLLETGHRGVDLEVLERMALAMGVPACVLLGYGDEAVRDGGNGLEHALSTALTSTLDSGTLAAAERRDA